MTEELTVAELMTSSPATVLPDENLARVYEMMSDRSIRHVPVVDRDGNLEGLVSHRDLVRSALFAFDDLPYSEQRNSLKKIRIREVMTTDPETVEPETAIVDAARTLLENKFGCLPAVAGTHLVGILTEADFVKHMVDEAQPSTLPRVEVEQVDQYSTSSPQKVERRTPVPKVAELMRKGGFRHMPVVEDGRVVGVISERILHMMANISGIDLVTAADVMTKNPYTVESGTSLLRVASDMASRRVGSAIVVQSGEPVGIFTATDALQALIKMLGAQTPEGTTKEVDTHPETSEQRTLLRCIEPTVAFRTNARWYDTITSVGIGPGDGGQQKMCFSAGVSLAVGSALLPAAGYCFRQASKRDTTYLALSTLPLVFGIQQICEGIVWTGLNSGNAVLVRFASLVFLAFALAFWPFWIPFSLSLIESRPAVRRALRVLATVGLSFGLYLFLPIATHSDDWLTTKIYFHSIQYDFATFPIFHMIPGPVWQTCYVAIVSVPLLVSAKDRGLRTFGILIGVSAALTQLAFWYAFYSVWCLFAAGLSTYLVYFFHRLPPGLISTRPVDLHLAVA